MPLYDMKPPRSEYNPAFPASFTPEEIDRYIVDTKRRCEQIGAERLAARQAREEAERQKELAELQRKEKELNQLFSDYTMAL